MAKHYIFDSENKLHKLAPTDALKDHHLLLLNGGKSKEANDSDYANVANQTKKAVLDGDNVVISDEESWSHTKEGFEKEIANQLHLVNDFLSNSNDSEWTQYRNNLQSIDTSTLTFPIDNFQVWFNSQSGFSSKSILELP